MFRPIASLTLAVVILSTAAHSQIRYVPAAPGEWRPWLMRADPTAARTLAATPADVKALSANLEGLNAILKKTPGFAAPIGFTVEAPGDLDLESFRPGQPAIKTLPIPADLFFGAFGVYETTRKG